MHDPSLDVKAKQKEPAGNRSQKKALRREGLTTETNKNEKVFSPFSLKAEVKHKTDIKELIFRT